MTQPLDLDPIRSAVADTFDQFEPTETRIARWEAAALTAGREVDRNALRAYMAVADAEQQALADDWAKSAEATAAEIRRLRARVWELERPAVEKQRGEVVQSFRELAAQCREDRDYEGEAAVLQRLEDRQQQWAREDAAAVSAAARP